MPKYAVLVPSCISLLRIALSRALVPMIGHEIMSNAASCEIVINEGYYGE